ncbi:hypothetical protein MFLAVUS_000244 [Mucor flavus]|uniref:Uncharacterized protein n=1 Tax=Mucor flavus TaxID=439312 RepID=A0ABP9YJ83_9FUNG
MPKDVELDDVSKDRIQDILLMFVTDYKFQKDSIYYDIKACPLNHLNVFYKLQGLCESMKLKKAPGNTSNQKSATNDEFDVKYVENLPQEQLIQTVGKYVLVDPGRRDLLYCLKETSTPDEKKTVIFTKNCYTKCFRHFRSLRKRNQPAVIKEAEANLSEAESS